MNLYRKKSRKSTLKVKIDKKNFTSNNGPRKSFFQKLVEFISSCLVKINQRFSEKKKIEEKKSLRYWFYRLFVNIHNRSNVFLYQDNPILAEEERKQLKEQRKQIYQEIKNLLKEK
jgi:hypothetical protein